MQNILIADNAKNHRGYFLCGFFLLRIEIRIVRPAEQIFDGDIEIVREEDQGFVIRLAGFRLVPAYRILAHIQFHRQSDL